MKRAGIIAGFSGLAFAMLAPSVSAEVLVPPNDPNINYYGRFDMSSAATSVSFNWPGSTIEAAFTGASIGVELTDGGGYFNVELDGVRLDSLPPTSTTHRTIRTGLSAGTHLIRLTSRGNGTSSNPAFKGFYLADGSALAAPPAKPTRKIEFIGDSWTAGDVINQTSTPIDQRYFDATLTYARRTSIAFHAQDILVARGGAGIVKSQGGAATLPTRYPKTLCDGTANWNFSSWTPDLVVVLLGINDYTIGGVTDTTLRTAYRNFLTTVRGNYPNVPLILVGLSGSTLTNTQAVASSFANATVFSSPITLSNAKALYQHPNKAQHQQIADSLIKVVTQVMGWDTASSSAIRPFQAAGRSGAGSALRSSLEDLVFPAEFAGTVKEVTAYDPAGRVAGRMTTGAERVSLARDLGLTPGVYRVVFRVVQP